MSLIGKILAAKLVEKVTERLDRAQRDPLPRRGRAGRAYRRNPKLVATLGAAMIGLIAAGVLRRRRS